MGIAGGWVEREICANFFTDDVAAWTGFLTTGDAF
tara:strand:+ start:1638 stop:1742 length:105 start_codon:yes stop_codon:yes gene_type:complete